MTTLLVGWVKNSFEGQGEKELEKQKQQQTLSLNCIGGRQHALQQHSDKGEGHSWLWCRALDQREPLLLLLLLEPV